MNLKIDDSFFPHFKAMIDSFVKDHKVEVIEDEYDYEKSYPKNVVVSSIEEVRSRVEEAQKRIESGEFHTQEQYELIMEKFFSEQLGMKR
jgi:hypothetical protein